MLVYWNEFVLDLSTFIHTHPGGEEVYRKAIGNDITPYINGLKTIEGVDHTIHKHSKHAFRTIMKLVVAKVDVSDKNFLCDITNEFGLSEVQRTFEITC